MKKGPLPFVVFLFLFLFLPRARAGCSGSLIWRASPLVAQETPVTCGLACFRSVLLRWGFATPSEDQLLHEFRLIPQDLQANFPGALDYLGREHGLNVDSRIGLTVTDLVRFLKNGESVFLNWFFVDSGHWSILVGIDAYYIYLMDPWLEPGQQHQYKSMPISDFISLWYLGPYFQGRAVRMSRYVLKP